MLLNDNESLKSSVFLFKKLRSFVKQTLTELSNEIKLDAKSISSHQLVTWDLISKIECVFCLSTGRAGTKFITAVFRQSPKTWVEHSPSPNLAHQSSLIYKNNVSNEALRWSFIHSRLDILSKVYQRNLCYVETNNRITLYAPAIAEILPNSKFIHLVRHPAEFVRSGMRRGYYEKMMPESSGHLIPRENDPLFHQWNSLDRIEKIAWQWNEINQKIEDFKKTVGSDRFLQVSSNKLFFESSIFAEISNFTGITLPEKTRIEKLRNRRINQQKTGQFPEYNNWTPEQQEMLKRQAHLASIYGYTL